MKWISVENRLPEEEVEVLGLVLYEDDTYGYDLNEHFDGEWLLSGSQVKVTHWMPLPEPPELPQQTP
jgi:hypothetical protein